MANIRQLGAAFQQRLYTPPPSSIRGIDNAHWPTASQPIAPFGPKGSEPLQSNFQFGQNLTYTPRADSIYKYEDLRKLSCYLLARLCIENVKDQISIVPWKIQPKSLPGETANQRTDRGNKDPIVTAITNLFSNPNPEEDWWDWVRYLIEEMLSIDASSIYIRRNKRNKVVELRHVPGDTITRYIDDNGFTPSPPNPAYAQLWDGIPRVNLTTDQLLYRPRNVVSRNTISSQLYGFGPTEQLAEEIKIGINRLNFIATNYTSGSIPDAIQIAPPGMDKNQIREAMDFINSRLSGVSQERHKWQIVQGMNMGDKPDQILFPKEKLLADPFDDMHIRKMAFGYGTSPQRLMRMINRASAESNQESAEKEGLLPFIIWLRNTMNILIQKKMGYEDYELVFSPFNETDPLKQAQADSTLTGKGLRTINEVRIARGEEPSSDPMAEKLGVLTSNGWLPLGETVANSMGGSGGD